MLHTATRASTLSQGRTDCGKLAVGYKADLCVIDTDTPQFTPMTDAACNVVYAAQGADVRLTMVDGEVLYRDGEFKTIDIEKVTAETQRSARMLSCVGCKEGQPMLTKANVVESAAYLKEKLPFVPEIALMLGSGIGPLADEVENPVSCALRRYSAL